MNEFLDDVNRYFFFFYTGLKNNLAYKFDIFFSMIFRVGSPLVMLAVWSVIFLGTGTATIGGFTLAQTYSYFFAVSLIALLIDEDLEWIIQSDVSNGLLATSLSKPISYPLASIASDFSFSVIEIVLMGLPFAIILIVLLHLAISTTYLLLFLAEVAVGFFFLYVVGMLLGTISIYITNAGGVFGVYYSALAFLSGLSIPLNFFPQAIGNVLIYYLPFQIEGYTPAATFLQEISVSQAVASTEAALVWSLGLLVLAYVFWKMSIKRIAIAGG